ncbi:hypothetical protein HDV00_002958 [Rhizophlyctis rosea]|nr:hypothetical protein HDV00_002958 [Rhizophlyctis rosea]
MQNQYNRPASVYGTPYAYATYAYPSPPITPVQQQPPVYPTYPRAPPQPQPNPPPPAYRPTYIPYNFEDIPQNFTFGAEFELLLSVPEANSPDQARELVAKYLTAQGININAYSYTHATTTDWKIVSDASVGGTGGWGMEIVSPVLSGPTGLHEIYRVLSQITAGKYKPISNSSAGFHVHVGKKHSPWTKEEIARVSHAFVKYEEVFTSLVPRSRRPGMNRYVRSNRRNDVMLEWDNRAVYDYFSFHIDKTMEELVDTMCPKRADDQQGRYYNLNLRPLARQSTIEFRLHSSTHEWPKACNWIKLLLYFCSRTIEQKEFPQNFAEERNSLTDADGRNWFKEDFFFRRLIMHEELRQWGLERIEWHIGNVTRRHTQMNPYTFWTGDMPQNRRGW